jgi:hypothetical protein
VLRGFALIASSASCCDVQPNARLASSGSILEMNIESYCRKAAIKRKRGPGN